MPVAENSDFEKCCLWLNSQWNSPGPLRSPIYLSVIYLTLWNYFIKHQFSSWYSRCSMSWDIKTLLNICMWSFMLQIQTTNFFPKIELLLADQKTTLGTIVVATEIDHLPLPGFTRNKVSVEILLFSFPILACMQQLSGIRRRGESVSLQIWNDS